MNPSTPLVEWSRERFGTPILDNYGTSEAFGGVVTNVPYETWEVHPGSMGRPNLGVDVRLIDRESGTTIEFVDELPKTVTGKIRRTELQ